MWFSHDGGDDDDQKNGQQQGDEKTGDYNLGDDIGERIGEGHDQVEDNIT